MKLTDKDIGKTFKDNTGNPITILFRHGNHFIGDDEPTEGYGYYGSDGKYLEGGCSGIAYDLVEEVKPEPEVWRWMPCSKGRGTSGLDRIEASTWRYKTKEEALADGCWGNAAMDTLTGQVYYD